jgi:hypothetical protein
VLRLLGIVLVGAFVLVCGPAAREPLTKQEYVDVVRSVTDDVDDRRLLDDVVIYAYIPCVSRICRLDTTTLIGEEWLRAERRLRGTLDALTGRFASLRPPADVARLHAEWMAALRRCAVTLRDLESRQKRFAGGDFELIVAEQMRPACLARLNEIIPAFGERGYVFAPTS